jgi:hypothetical protein
MIDDDVYGSFGGMIGRGNRITRRKFASAPLCPPQITTDLTWARIRAAARKTSGWPPELWHYLTKGISVWGNLSSSGLIRPFLRNLRPFLSRVEVMSVPWGSDWELFGTTFHTYSSRNGCKRFQQNSNLGIKTNWISQTTFSLSAGTADIPSVLKASLQLQPEVSGVWREPSRK